MLGRVMVHSLKKRSLLLLLVIASLSVTPSIAQDAAPPAETANGKRILRADFFANYGPITALDMVQRIPGFSIEGSEGRRGFGENAGNVLIDGDRPSTKSDDIFTLLGRIPASEVDFVELIEQAGGDGEAQGKGQIVNIVRKVSAKLSGTYSANLLIGTHYGITPFGSGSATLRRGPTSYELNFSSFSERLRGFGPEDFKNGAGQLVERRSYLGRGAFDQFSLGGAIKTKSGDVKINANGKFTINHGTDRRFGTYTDAAGVFIGSEKLFTDAPVTDSSFEIGGDIEFPLAAKLNSKLVGLYQSGAESVDASIETARVGAPNSLFETRNRNRPSEAVFRVQNDWTGLSDHAVQFGAEVAYNRLDAKFSAASSSNGTVSVFPASNVLVQETRVEPFLSDVWSVSPAWKLEAGAILEFSKLKLSGDSNAQRSFQFIKPRLVATWTVDRATTLELRAERQVAQLDFGEFATSVDLGQGNQVDAGNQDLVPEKTNSFSAKIRHKFLERGSIQFEASYQNISDTQDLLLITTRDAAGNITGRFDGAGNIGKSKRWNGELEITLPFDWLTSSFGISGLELKYVGHYHGSSLTDPVTGLSRRVSYRPLWHQNWDLRHDIKGSGIVWGLSWAERAPGNAYFSNQYRRENFGSNANVFVEYNRFKLGTLRLEAMTFSKLYRNRFLYNDTRASNLLTQIINRKRTLDPRIQISLSGKF
jgi:outer membrane receptor protein involved in Fe transport